MGERKNRCLSPAKQFFCRHIVPPKKLLINFNDASWCSISRAGAMSTLRSKKNIELRRIHGEIAGLVEARISEFQNIWDSGNDTKLFIELVFCLLTQQSCARRC